jgi:hypothetical protein
MGFNPIQAIPELHSTGTLMPYSNSGCESNVLDLESWHSRFDIHIYSEKKDRPNGGIHSGIPLSFLVYIIYLIEAE